MSINSVDKLLDYISKVSKEPIIVNGKSFISEPPRSVTISPSFFWKDSCIMCGRCCMNETIVWTQEGLKRIMNYMDSLSNQNNDSDVGIVRISDEDLSDLSSIIQQHTINIQGEDRVIYVCPKDSAYSGQWHYFEGKGDRQRCHWMRELDGKFCCGIHPIRSVTCALPHIRFYGVKKTNRTVLRMMQYGRNHKLGCPIELGEVSEEGMQEKIHWLDVLRQCADDLGIKTWLPEIVEYLEQGNREPVTFGEAYKRGGRVKGTSIKSAIKAAGSEEVVNNEDTRRRFMSLLRGADKD